MTVLYLYQYFGTPQGGWSTRVYEMARRWVVAGHNIKVLTTLYDKSDLTATGMMSKHNIEGINVYVLNLELSNKHSFLYRVFTFVAYAITSIYFVLFNRYDVVIASSGPITVGLPGLIARYIRRKPLVFEVRDLWPEGAVQLGLLKSRLMIRLSYWFEKQCYKGASEIVALSPGMAASIRSRHGHSNIHVIPNACDVSLFQGTSDLPAPPPWTQGKHVFVYTGSLGVMDDCMQIVHAAEALQMLHREDIQVVILGEGQDRPRMETYVLKHNLHNIKLLGLLPKKDVVSWLSWATAAILVFKDVPVLHTSSPNKMFDAFAAGKPLIQTTQGWIRELLVSEKCGLNVAPNHPEQMARAMMTLVDQPENTKAMGKNALRLARENFNRDKLAADMLDILKIYE